MAQNLKSLGKMNFDLQEFIEAYNKAVEEGKETFIYQDVPLVTDYAKFLIEYLETLKTP